MTISWSKIQIIFYMLIYDLIKDTNISKIKGTVSSKNILCNKKTV